VLTRFTRYLKFINLLKLPSKFKQVMVNKKLSRFKNNYMQCVDELLASKTHLVRFGDGEIKLMLGFDIPYQKCTPEIQRSLRQIIFRSPYNIALGIPGVFFSQVIWIPKSYRETKIWLPSFIITTLLKLQSNRNFFNAHYFRKETGNLTTKLHKIRNASRIICVVANNTAMRVASEQISESFLEIEVPSENSMDKYEEIEKQLTNIINQVSGLEVSTILFSGGPVSKFLIYNLAGLASSKNVILIDTGHFFEHLV